MMVIKRRKRIKMIRFKSQMILKTLQQKMMSKEKIRLLIRIIHNKP